MRLWQHFFRLVSLGATLAVVQGVAAQDQSKWTASQAGSQPVGVGETPGTPVHTGFVFFDGRYVDPPYTVSRKGLTLSVNDRPVQSPYKAPQSSPIDRLVRLLDRARSDYEKGLRQGDCYLFFRGGTKHLDWYPAIVTLPTTIKTLRSPLSDAMKEKTLRRSGWQHSLPAEALETLIRDFCASPRFDQRLQEATDQRCQADEYGTTSSAPVHTGFVFIDGEYIDAPYVVTRKGLALAINGRIIQPPSGVSRTATTVPTSLPTDPAVPPDIDRETSKYNPFLRDYLVAKFAYIRSRYSGQEQRRLLREAYAALPCVEQSQLDPQNPEVLLVTWSDGKADRVLLVSPKRMPAKLDRESVLHRLEAQRSMYEDRLRKGDYYFFFIAGGELTGPASGAAMILPQLVPILCSNDTIEEKVQKAQAMEIKLDRDMLEMMAMSFSASSQLDERIARLTR